MPQNFTITRVQNTTDTYGCTDFSTVQQGGDTASIVANASFDASITWNIQANTGYDVTVSDFSILNATATSVTVGSNVYTVYQGGNLPSDVLAVSFLQVDANNIECIIWLAATGQLNVSGTSYVMPSVDTLMKIPIVGCATLEPQVYYSTFQYTHTGKNTTSYTPTMGTSISRSSADVGSSRTHTFQASAVNFSDSTEPTLITSMRFAADSGYYFDEVPNFTIPEEVRHLYEVRTTGTSYTTGRTVIVLDNTKTDGTVISRTIDNAEVDDVTISLYYINTKGVTVTSNHNITMSHSTAAIPTVTHGINSFDIDIPRKEGERIISSKGLDAKFKLKGDVYGGSIESDVLYNAPKFSIKVYNSYGDHFDFVNRTWVSSSYTLTKELQASFDYNSIYPSLGNDINNLIEVDDSTTPSSIFFPPLLTTHVLDTVNTSLNLTLPSEDINIKVGMDVSGTGIQSNTKVAAVSGSSIVLDKAMNATGSNIGITFSKSSEKYTVELTAVNTAAGNTTVLDSSVPTSASPLEIYQYKDPKITIIGHSYSGQFTIPTGIETTLPFNTDLSKFNGRNKITFSATIQPGGGKSDVQTTKSTLSFDDVIGVDDITMPLNADLQSYQSSKYIKLENTKGLSPGMIVASNSI